MRIPLEASRMTDPSTRPCRHRPSTAAACAGAVFLAFQLVGSGLTAAEPAGELRLVLTRDKGEPLGRQVHVHLYDAFSEVGRGYESDQAGAVTITDVQPGRYDLWVDGHGEDGDLCGALCRGIQAAGPGEPEIRLAIPAAGRVSGRLVLPDGAAPAAGYVAAVQSGTMPPQDTEPDRLAAAYARGAQSCYAQVTVGDDGAFELRGLAPGRLSLDIRKPGDPGPWCTISGVEVQPGSTTDLGTITVSLNGWQSMFDRRSLDGWAESGLYGQREVRVEHDTIVLPHGSDMTGITWQRDLPRIDFEVSLQAKRVEGSDFFCGLTFPVNDSYCSLILGGWGGSLVGLSCLDGSDASQNETSTWIDFAEETWYRVRLRVTAERITAWLDDKRIVDVGIEHRLISTRWEVDKCQPFGFATWRTTGALRDIRIRQLDEAELGRR